MCILFEHIRPKRFTFKMNPVITSAFFSTMKRKLSKEKSPAGEKLPEILSQWQQKSQLLTRFARSSDRWFLLTPLLRISYRQFFTCGIVFKNQIIRLILNHIIYIIIKWKLFWTVLVNVHIRPKRFILKMNPVISSAFFSSLKIKRMLLTDSFSK